MSDLPAAILNRADEVAREYLGFFEWVAWGVLRQAPVYILIGRSLVDVFEVFALALRPPQGNPGLVAAACIAANGSLRPVRDFTSLYRVNHLVEAVPLRELVAIGALSFSGDASSFSDLLSVEAQRAGFGIRRTRSDGHCAVHVMANWEGKANSLATMLSIRLELAAPLRDRANDRVWHDAYVTCEGYDPPVASLSGQKARPRKFIGCAGPPPPPLSPSPHDPPSLPPQSGTRI